MMDAFEARPVTWLLSVAMLVAKVLLMLVIWVGDLRWRRAKWWDQRAQSSRC